MKAYLIPVKKLCNAKCSFCITNFYNPKGQEFIDINKTNFPKGIKKIEITGGGEPTLHPNLNNIIEKCVKIAPTTMYTNGALLTKKFLEKNYNINKLSELSISIAHNNPETNNKIMGVNPNLKEIKNLKVKKKFSLILLKDGVNSKDKLEKYIKWASNYCNKIVVRQLFNESTNLFGSQFIKLEKIIEEFDLPFSENPILKINGVDVEFETCNCSIRNDNWIITSENKVKKEWI